MNTQSRSKRASVIPDGAGTTVAAPRAASCEPDQPEQHDQRPNTASDLDSLLEQSTSTRVRRLQDHCSFAHNLKELIENGDDKEQTSDQRQRNPGAASNSRQEEVIKIQELIQHGREDKNQAHHGQGPYSYHRGGQRGGPSAAAKQFMSELQLNAAKKPTKAFASEQSSDPPRVAFDQAAKAQESKPQNTKHDIINNDIFNINKTWALPSEEQQVQREPRIARRGGASNSHGRFLHAQVATVPSVAPSGEALSVKFGTLGHRNGAHRAKSTGRPGRRNRHSLECRIASPADDENQNSLMQSSHGNLDQMGLTDQFQPLSVNNTWARLQSIKSGSSSERFKTIQPSRFAGKTGSRQLKARLQASSCLNATSAKKAFHHGDLELLQVPSVSKCLAQSILPKHSAVLREYIELWARSPHSRATADDLLQSRWEKASHPQPSAQPASPDQVIEPQTLASHLEEQAMALRIGGIGSLRTQLGRKQPGLHDPEGAGGSAKINEQMLLNFTERMIERLKMLEAAPKDGEGNASHRHLADAWPRDHLTHQQQIDGIIAALSQPARVKFARQQEAKEAKISIQEDGNNQQDNINTQQYLMSSAFGQAAEDAIEAETAEQREAEQDLTPANDMSAPASPSSWIKDDDIRYARGGAIYQQLPSLTSEHAMPEDMEQRDWDEEAHWEANIEAANAVTSSWLESAHTHGHEASTIVDVGQKEEKKKRKHSYIETLPPAVKEALERSDGSLQLPLKSREVLRILDSPIAARDACLVRQTIPTHGDESDKEEQEEVSSSTAGRGRLGAVTAKGETSILSRSTPQRQPAFSAFHSNRVVLEQFQNRRNSQKIGYLKKKKEQKRIENPGKHGDRREHWASELNQPGKRSVSPYSPVRLAKDFDVKYSNQFAAKLRQQKRLEEFCMECILQEERSMAVKMGEQAQIEVDMDADAPPNGKTRQACAPLIEHDVRSNSPGSSATPASALTSLHLGFPIGSRQSQANNDTMLAIAPSKDMQTPGNSRQPQTVVAGGRGEAPCQQATLERLSSNIATPNSQQRAARKGSLCELDIQDREALVHSAFGQLTATGAASRESAEKVKAHGAGSATATNREHPKDLKVQSENGAAANAKEDYNFTRLAKFEADQKLDSASQSPEKLCKDPALVLNPALATIKYDNGIELASNRKSLMDIYQTKKLEGESEPTRKENEPKATNAVNQINMVDNYALESREKLKSEDENGLAFAEAWYTELMGPGAVESREQFLLNENHVKQNAEGPGAAGGDKPRVLLLDSGLQTDSIETIKARRAAHANTQYLAGRCETKGQLKGQSRSIQRHRLGVGAGRNDRRDQEHFMEVFGVAVGKTNRQQQKDGYQANDSQFQNAQEVSIQNPLKITNRHKINNNGLAPFGQQQAFKIPSSTTQGLFMRSPRNFGDSSKTCTPKKPGYPVKCSLAFHHGAMGAYDATGLTERSQNTATLNQSIQQNVTNSPRQTPDKGARQQQQYSVRSIHLGQEQAKGAGVGASIEDQDMQREGEVERSRQVNQQPAEKKFRKDAKHSNEGTRGGEQHRKAEEYQANKAEEVKYAKSNLQLNLGQNEASVKDRQREYQAAEQEERSGMLKAKEGSGTSQQQSNEEGNQTTTKVDGPSQPNTASRRRGADGPGSSALPTSTKRLAPYAAVPKRTGKSILNSTLLSPTMARGKDSLVMNQKQTREVVVVHLTPAGTAAEAAAPRAKDGCNYVTFATQGTHNTQNSLDEMGNTKRIDPEQAEAPSKQPQHHGGALDEPSRRTRDLQADSRTMTLPLSAGHQLDDDGQRCQGKQDEPRQEQELGLESSDVPSRDVKTLLNSGAPVEYQVSGTATNKSALVSEDGAIMTANLDENYLPAKATKPGDAQGGQRSMQRKREAALGWPAGVRSVRRHHAGRAHTVEPRHRQTGPTILNSDPSPHPEAPLKSSNLSSTHKGAQSRILPHNLHFGIEQLPQTGSVFNKFTFKPKQSQPSSLMRKIKPQSLSKERAQPKAVLGSAGANPPVDAFSFDQLLIPQLFSAPPGSVIWDSPHPGRAVNEAVQPGVTTPSSVRDPNPISSPWRSAASGPMQFSDHAIETAERAHEGAEERVPFFERRAAGAQLHDPYILKTIPKQHNQNVPKPRYPDKIKGRQNDNVAAANTKQPEAHAPSTPADRVYIPIEQISYAVRPRARDLLANQGLDTVANDLSWQPLLAQMLSDSVCGSASGAGGLSELLRQQISAADPGDVLPSSFDSNALAGYGLDQLMTLQQQLQAQILLQQQLQIQKNQQHLRYAQRESPSALDEAKFCKLRAAELHGQLNDLQALGQGQRAGTRAPVSLVADLRPLAEQARPLANGGGEEGETWLKGGGRAWTEGSAFQQHLASPGGDQWSRQCSFSGHRELSGDSGRPAQDFQRYVANSGASKALLDQQSGRQGQNVESSHLSPTCQVKKYKEGLQPAAKMTQDRNRRHPELRSHAVPVRLDAIPGEASGHAGYQLERPVVSFLDVPRSGYDLLQGRTALGAGATIILSSAALSALSGPGELDALPDRAAHAGTLASNEPGSTRRGHDDSALTEIREIGQQRTPGTSWVASTGTILVIGRDPQADLSTLDQPTSGSARPAQAPPISPVPNPSFSTIKNHQ